MFSCTRYETQQIQEGGASSVTRHYPAGCPHQVGGKIVFTSKYIDPDGGEMPFAVATIMSIRPVTFAQMRANDKYAQMDGFPNAYAWEQHFSRVLYPGFGTEAALFRLQFRLEEMDRDMESLRSRVGQDDQEFVDNSGSSVERVEVG